MPEMEFGSKDVTPSTVTRTLYGEDERELVGDQKVKVQFLGSGSEVVCQEGPPAGKKWRVYTQVQIGESDA